MVSEAAPLRHDELDPVLELDPRRALQAGDGHYAVVDIGSNSVRLVVYDQLGRAPFPRFNEKSFCALGADLDRTGELSPEASRRTIDALRRFRAIADAMGVSRIDVIATEAVRRARNGAQLAAAIEAASGLPVRVLSGEEEARFAAQGVISGLDRPTGMVGDMGGGSVEVAEIADGRIGQRLVSLPLGALPVQAMIDEDRSGARRRVDAILDAALPPALATDPVFYAVGGSWRAFARVHMASVQAAVPVVHGYSISAGEARALARTIRKLSGPKIAELPGIPSRRAGTLPAAALVLDRILKKLAPERVLFSALGVREGWLYAQLPEAVRRLDPLLEGAQALGAPNARVPEFACALARWTKDLFPGESPGDRRLRLAACALSDIAWRDHPGAQAIESFRRLLQFPLVGLDHGERVFIATAIHARYAGKLDDARLQPAVDVLSPSLRRRAQILGRAMLLGHRLSGSVPEILDGARLQIEADLVRLVVIPAARVPDSDVVAERLQLLAAAIGVRGTEVVEAG